MKRIVSLVLVFSMVATCGLSANVGKAQTSKKVDRHDYIIHVNDSEEFAEVKDDLKEEEKIVVKHKKADEKYLDNNRTIVARMTANEAEEYSEETGITVEKDFTLYASETTTFTVPVENPFKDMVNFDPSTEEKVSTGSVEPPKLDTERTDEYSDNPKKFIPCKAITDEKKKNEIVPWNISCVAGTPHKNKYHGKNVKVAVIDSGIDTHNELNTKDWVDFSDRVNGYKPIDNNGHGTSIAGVIGARINGIGMEGIASESKVYSLKVLNEDNTASVSSIVKAIEWCITKKIDIINMSFGMNQYSSILATAIHKANQHGIVMISAAGNETSQVQYPARFPEVISVGSVNEKLQASEFSNNENVDLVAPGEEAQTTGFLGSYCKVSGTSIAAAHVTGVAAAILSSKRSMSNKELRTCLIESGTTMGDGSKLVSYESALSNISGKHKYTTSLVKLKDTVGEMAQNEGCYVKGSWISTAWYGIDRANGTGHQSMINKMPLNYFGENNESDNIKTENRSIVADAVYRTDKMEWMSATHQLGNAHRNENGVIDGNSGHCYSPYHAKTNYSVQEVVNHMLFLYELARRRIVLGSNLELDSTKYNGDKYYSLYIGRTMKRRMIVDLSAMYDQQSIVFRNSINMNTVKHKGYMVLGVLLHLVQDLQAHRAKVTTNMLYDKADGTVYHGNDVFGDTKSECRINGSNIIGLSNGNYDKYWELYEKVKAGKMSMIRLKDYLIGWISFTCNNNTRYDCESYAAYEDNPYFYTDRYTSSLWFSESYINRMMQDTATGNATINSYYATENVPLVNAKW